MEIIAKRILFGVTLFGIIIKSKFKMAVDLNSFINSYLEKDEGTNNIVIMDDFCGLGESQNL